VHADGIVKCGGWVGSRQLLGGVEGIQFYEGVKDFVEKDAMVIVKVVAGCMFDVYRTCIWNLSMVFR
jgi:hypothetical protein